MHLAIAAHHLCTLCVTMLKSVENSFRNDFCEARARSTRAQMVSRRDVFDYQGCISAIDHRYVCKKYRRHAVSVSECSKPIFFDLYISSILIVNEYGRQTVSENGIFASESEWKEFRVGAFEGS